jgi:hypothetical protein
MQLIRQNLPVLRHFAEPKAMKAFLISDLKDYARFINTACQQPLCA